MKGVVDNAHSGKVEVIELPEPELRANGILVRTRFSAISSGTERAKLELGEKGLVAKALARPELVRQVVELAQQQGVRATYTKVRSRLDSLSALGYSCSGTVLAVGEGVTEFQPGDRVACAGAGYANHCQVNFVPRNLAAHIPAGVSFEAASLTTIGAIALQGLRQSQAQLGETVAVIGVGLVGLLTVQLAKAAGCRTVALDVDAERVSTARRMGADVGLTAEEAANPAIAQQISRYGADVVILTAATPSSEPIETAARLLRDRGRIVVVGDVGMNLSRRSAYAKELSIALSRSYGPGRYDSQYEEKGWDYPIGYVRWTEKRNMEAFLDLLAAGRIDVAPLLEHRFSLDHAESAYAGIRALNSYTALLEYPEANGARLEPIPPRSVPLPRQPRSGVLRVSCIGAGSFARDVVLPYLAGAKDVRLEAVASASGLTAENARRMFRFRSAVTAEEAVHSQADLLFVLSRHDSHARYVAAILENQTPVFVEKPLATSPEELRDIAAAYEKEAQQGRSPFLMVGFNRRFAPFTEDLRRFFDNRTEPMMVHARINAGYLGADHWTHENGGRIVGEFCHFVDWARAVVNSPIRKVSAVVLPDVNRYRRDNVAVVLSFDDGSVANLLYLANGDKSVSKEYFEVFCQGAIAQIDDFRTLTLTRNARTQKKTSKRDKGHHALLEQTLAAVREGRPAPILFEELFEVTQATLDVHAAIACGGEELPHSLDSRAGVAI